MSRRILVLMLVCHRGSGDGADLRFLGSAPQACLAGRQRDVPARGARRAARLHGADRSRGGRSRTCASNWPTRPDEADFVLVDDGEARAWLPRPGNPQREDRHHRALPTWWSASPLDAGTADYPHLRALTCVRAERRGGLACDRAIRASTAAWHIVRIDATRVNRASAFTRRIRGKSGRPDNESQAAQAKLRRHKVRRRWLLSGPR